MAIEKGKEYLFSTSYSDLARYNGTIVTIEYPLIDIRVDSPMYRARFIDGRYYDVLESELSMQ